MSRMTILSRTMIVLAAVLTAGSTAWADPTGMPDLMIQLSTEGGSTWTSHPDGQATGEGNMYSFVGQQNPGHGLWSLTYDLTVDPDPQINAVFGVTNNTAAVQTYIINVMLPIFPAIPGGTVMDGSMQGGVTDNTNNATPATIATDPVSGAPMYYGMIDGVPALPLNTHPTSASASYPASANIPAVSALGVPGPAALASIGIQHKFTLTPGDSASITSLFVVTPEPASLMILGLGGLMVLRRRR